MKISILGCGWLGLPLAERLIKQGHSVKGSTTSPQKLSLLEQKQIEPFLLQLNPGISADKADDFFDADLLILNIPPGRNRDDVEEFVLAQVQSVIEKANTSSIQKVIFASSTSVYPAHCGIVAEADAKQGTAARASGNALLKAEQRLLTASGFDTVVLRFGGLYGPGRHPVTYLSGRTDLSGGNAPVNLIHLEDCIGIIEALIEKDLKGEIFNGVSDGHPPKHMYYPAAARAMGLEPPEFAPDEEENYKIVSNRKLKELLGYSFIYPNPMDVLAVNAAND